MARKKGNPLSGKFRDPPQEGNASIPEQVEQDTDQIKLNDQGDAPTEPAEAPAEPVPADAPAPEQADRGEAPAEPAEAPAEPAPADTPAPEQADQGDAPTEPAEVPAEPVSADAPAPEQADRGEAPAGPAEAPAEPAPADTPAPEQADQGDAPTEPAEVPAEPAPADTPAPEQADQDDAPTEPAEVPAEPVPADAPAPEQANRGEAPAEPAEVPAEPVPADAPAPEQADRGEAPAGPAEAPAEPAPADTPAPEQADQDDAPTEPAEVPAEPVPADAPAPEQADRGEAPAEPAEAPADPAPTDAPNLEHSEARFVKLAEIVPLPGTYIKDTPREDYTELLDSIKANGLEKPIILRKSEKGDFQLVDGFHRCEAMKQAGMLEVPAELYEMPLAEASRYRKGHRTDPGLPIPGTLIPAHPPKEEPAAEADAPAQDEKEFVVPKDFKVPIVKEGQPELVTTLKVADIHPFEGHPFPVRDNQKMWELVESVKRFGVLEPTMVINRPAGGYEMVSGHRRMRACQLAGIQTIPGIVRNLDRDEAIIAMVDSNLKREELTPMEKARAYQMKTDAMRRKVGRRSKTEAATGEKRLTADQELAQQVGESVATVQRYKQLNDLVPEMQEMVDSGKIPLNTGADISRMKPEEQRVLADAIQKEDKVPTGAQAKAMKEQSKEGTLTIEAIKQAVAPTKREENPPLKITLMEEDLRPFFPDKRTTAPDAKKGVLEALALRQKLLERQAAQKAAAAKDEAKPPDKPLASGDKKPPAPGSEKKPEPSAGGVKKPSGPTAGGKGKKPAAPKPKKSNPSR